jgi:hypothetical protein
MRHANVQIISNRLLENYNTEWLKNTEIKNPRSLDEFDFTIIDLNEESIWRNRADNNNSVNILSDLQNLSKMITNSEKTKIVFLLPQNLTFKYKWHNNSAKFTRSIEIKNMLKSLEGNFLKNIFSIFIKSLVFENTETIVNGQLCKANFFFTEDENVITKSEKSKKATTISIDNLILTTLKICSLEKLKTFLIEIGLRIEREKAPKWLDSIYMFNDLKLQKVISDNKKIIDTANKKNQRV